VKIQRLFAKTNLKIPVCRIRNANSAPQETKNNFLKKSNNLHRKPAEIL